MVYRIMQSFIGFKPLNACMRDTFNVVKAFFTVLLFYTCWMLGSLSLVLFPFILVPALRRPIIYYYSFLVFPQFLVKLKPTKWVDRFFMYTVPQKYFRYPPKLLHFERVHPEIYIDQEYDTKNDEECLRRLESKPMFDKTLLAFHPHGVIATNMVWNGRYRPDFHSFTQCVYHGADILLHVPWFGRLLLALSGGQSGASKKYFIKSLQSGKNSALIPGGFQEATYTKHGVESVYIKYRQGFIKYCIQYGYRIVPIYTFGENNLYYTLPLIKRIGLWLNKFNIPGVIFWGNPFLPFLPKRDVKLLTCCGKPLELPQIDQPTTKDVNYWHTKYIESLKNVFDENKVLYGIASDVELIIY